MPPTSPRTLFISSRVSLSATTRRRSRRSPELTTTRVTALVTISPGFLATMSRPRILIVEDERALTDVLSYNLEREGFETIVTHDGPEGLRKAQTLLPDLVILDLMLPVMNGLEVCRELRAGERTRHVPILMLTALAAETDQ